MLLCVVYTIHGNVLFKFYVFFLLGAEVKGHYVWLSGKKKIHIKRRSNVKMNPHIKGGTERRWH